MNSNENDKGLTSAAKQDVREIVTEIVEESINGLAVIINNTFISFHEIILKEIRDSAEDVKSELKEEFNRKFDALGARIDHVLDIKADRRELQLVEKRVTALESGE
jgi:hypothetical protein